MLLALRADAYDVSDFAFDARRVEESAKELSTGSPSAMQPVVALALRRWLRSLHVDAFQPALNDRIAKSVLGCFAPGLFHQTGKLSSIWQIRMTRSSDDAVGMIDQLLDESSAKVVDDWPRRV